MIFLLDQWGFNRISTQTLDKKSLKKFFFGGGGELEFSIQLNINLLRFFPLLLLRFEFFRFRYLFFFFLFLFLPFLLPHPPSRGCCFFQDLFIFWGIFFLLTPSQSIALSFFFFCAIVHLIILLVLL